MSKEIEIKKCFSTELSKAESAGIRKLHNELKELDEDKARLDLIEQARLSVSYNNHIMQFTVQKQWQVCGCIGKGFTVRAAIDDAYKNL